MQRDSLADHFRGSSSSSVNRIERGDTVRIVNDNTKLRVAGFAGAFGTACVYRAWYDGWVVWVDQKKCYVLVWKNYLTKTASKTDTRLPGADHCGRVDNRIETCTKYISMGDVMYRFEYPEVTVFDAIFMYIGGKETTRVSNPSDALENRRVSVHETPIRIDAGTYRTSNASMPDGVQPWMLRVMIKQLGVDCITIAEKDVFVDLPSVSIARNFEKQGDDAHGNVLRAMEKYSAAIEMWGGEDKAPSELLVKRGKTFHDAARMDELTNERRQHFAHQFAIFQETASVYVGDTPSLPIELDD